MMIKPDFKFSEKDHTSLKDAGFSSKQITILADILYRSGFHLERIERKIYNQGWILGAIGVFIFLLWSLG